MEDAGNETIDFKTFYKTAYRSDHVHPANLALHCIGVVAGLAVIIASVTIWPLWTAIAFPIVHVAPGLLGHRLFDRDEKIGNMRLMRKDFPLWWFVAANHLMAIDVFTLRWSSNSR